MSASPAPQAMREKAMRFAAKRKEDYIGARVPKPLKDKIIHQAREMNIPVSLLLRKVLEKVFQEQQLGEVIKDFLEQDNSGTKPEAVRAWSRVELAASCLCSVCASEMPAGGEAFIPLGEEQSLLFLCQNCKNKK